MTEATFIPGTTPKSILCDGDGSIFRGTVFDLLQLSSNEGENYDGILRLLFAASGDLRNVVKTVAQLPSDYSGSLEITINDRDFDIVSCNVILLLVALTVKDVDEAIDCMTHLWYSALRRKSDLELIQCSVSLLIKEVCKTITDTLFAGVFPKTW